MEGLGLGVEGQLTISVVGFWFGDVVLIVPCQQRCTIDICCYSDLK